MRLAPPSADRIRERRSKDWERTHSILLGQEKSLKRIFKHYIEGGGSHADHVHRLLRSKIDDIAVAQCLTQPGESVFDQHGRILPECLRELCPENIDAFFDVGPQDGITTHELMEGGVNEHHDVSLPQPMNMVLHRLQRPSVRAYAMQGAELFVSPSCYQLLNTGENWFWPSASSRTLSKLVTSVPTLPIADHIVIIHDRYPAENFAHFLFDWIPRLGIFIESGLEPPDRCLFLMGGILDQFRAILLRAVHATYGIEPDQFFFPEDALRLRTSGNVYWFSDQVDTYMHPAQMANAKSIGVIRKISKAIGITEGRFDRIYISRGDTGRRRVANEDQLWSEISNYGFEMIRLADHAVEEQISLIRGAKHLIAPHGMGLTHLALHQGRPSVLELFNPRRGGDDYALISKAMGFDYQFILGEPTDNEFDDFSISPAAVVAACNGLNLSSLSRAGSAVPVNLIPHSSSFGSHWHPGWQAERARIAEDVAPLIAGNAVMRHIRAHPDEQIDSNAGAWSDIPVEGARIYTASCWVCIPERFAGERVAISLGEWARQSRVLADLSIRGTWQRLRATATSPANAEHCHVVFRIDAKNGDAVFSTCWQLELGPEPSGYVAT